MEYIPVASTADKAIVYVPPDTCVAVTSRISTARPPGGDDDVRIAWLRQCDGVLSPGAAADPEPNTRTLSGCIPKTSVKAPRTWVVVDNTPGATPCMTREARLRLLSTPEPPVMGESTTTFVMLSALPVKVMGYPVANDPP